MNPATRGIYAQVLKMPAPHADPGFLASPGVAPAQDLTPLSISLEEYPYPYPVAFFDLHQEGQDLRMAYMDVKPDGPGNGKTVVLLHGKNFPASYWRFA